jgi:hypothetical protein
MGNGKVVRLELRVRIQRRSGRSEMGFLFLENLSNAMESKQNKTKAKRWKCHGGVVKAVSGIHFSSQGRT